VVGIGKQIFAEAGARGLDRPPKAAAAERTKTKTNQLLAIDCGARQQAAASRQAAWALVPRRGVRARVRPCNAQRSLSLEAETDSPGHVRTESRSLARSLQQAPASRQRQHPPPSPPLRSQPQVGHLTFLSFAFQQSPFLRWLLLRSRLKF
jgi:hypothetical protein